MNVKHPENFDEHDIPTEMVAPEEEIAEHGDAVFEEWAAGISGDLEKEEDEDLDMEKIPVVPFRRKKGNQKTTTIGTCEICGVVLKHPSRIKEHMRTHTGEKPFECDICGMRFTQRTPMINHYRVQHLGDLPFICSFGCGKRFVNVSRKKAHELRHMGLKRNGPPRPHLKPVKKLICPSLDETPPRSNALPNTANANFVAPPSISNSFRDVSDPSVSTTSSQTTTRSTDKQMNKDSAQRIDDVISSVLARVLAPHTEEEEEGVAEKTTETASKRTYISRRAPTMAQCSVCGLMLKHPSKISEHIRTHTGEKPYECGECGLCLSKATSLRVHIRRMHTGERPFQCQWDCGMWFVTESVRKEHEMAVHSGVKRYSCHVKGCHTHFARRSYLMRHRKNAHGQSFSGIFDEMQVAGEEAADPVLPMMEEKEMYIGQNHVMLFNEEVKMLTHFDEEDFVEQQ